MPTNINETTVNGIALMCNVEKFHGTKSFTCISMIFYSTTEPFSSWYLESLYNKTFKKINSIFDFISFFNLYVHNYSIWQNGFFPHIHIFPSLVFPLSHQVTYCKGTAQAGFVILTRYLQSIEYIHSLLSISQMRLLFCHVPERVFTRNHHY